MSNDPRCNFYIGQKVVWAPGEEMLKHELVRCIIMRQGGIMFCVPEAGRVYHVRGLVMDTLLQRVGVYLVEIVNPVCNFQDGVKEPGFWHVEFKPATDISELEKLLTTKPVLEDA